jgi:integrase
MKQGKFNEMDIERLTIHSLRHTFITVANRTGISPWTIATLVGHTLGNSITGLYIHHNLEELKKAQSQIIDALKEGRY